MPGIDEPRQHKNVRKELVTFFIVAFAISWGGGGLAILFFGPPSFGYRATVHNPLFLFLFGFGPTLASIVVSWAFGREQLRELMKTVLRWRFGARWYLVILVGIPVIGLCADSIAAAWTGRWSQIFAETGVGQTLRQMQGSILVGTLVFIGGMFGGPLSEEPGWRGYALPRMLELQNSTNAAIVLGIIWGLWHLPLFLFGDTPQHQFSFPAFWAQCVGLSVIITWIFINTQASALAAILVHFVSNITFNMRGTAASWATAAVVTVAAMLLISTGSLRSSGPGNAPYG